MVRSKNGDRFIIAQRNPFQPAVKGVKVPDDNSAESGTFFTNDFYVMPQLASNAWCIALLPHLGASYITPNTSTATDWAWQASYGGMNSATLADEIAESFKSVRAVAHGLRLQSSSQMNIVNGYVHVCYSTFNSSDSTWDFPTNVSQMRQMPGYVRLPLAALIDRPYIVVNKFTDDKAWQYRAVNHVIARQQDAESGNIGWQAIILAFDATPGTSLQSSMAVDILTHWEGLVNNGFLNRASPAAPADQKALEMGKAIVESTGALQVDDSSISAGKDYSYILRRLK